MLQRDEDTDSTRDPKVSVFPFKVEYTFAVASS